MKKTNKKFTLFLTHGMMNLEDGFITLGSFDTLDEMFHCVDNWKKSTKKTARYRINDWDTYTFFTEDNAINIDFGDYGWFLCMKGNTVDLQKEYDAYIQNGSISCEM